MSRDEKVRLILFEQEGYPDSHTTGINHGAASVFGKWPSYIASAIWCIVFIITVITLAMVLIFIILVREGKIVQESLYLPNAKYILTQEIENEFCNQMIEKSHKKRQDIPERDLDIFDSGNNIFYMVLKPLSKYSSCSVESVIKKSNNKNIFLMFLKDVEDTFYAKELSGAYQNFNLISIDGEKLCRGSPFEGKWQGDERSLFEVATLTVWQFGGTVLSEDLLMVRSGLNTGINSKCLVDPELIYCPDQCAAYLYDLIGASLKSNRNATITSVIDASITQFCGSQHFVYTGCSGVGRIDDADICQRNDPKCTFVRVHDWLREGHDIWEEIEGYCPVTVKAENMLIRRLAKERMHATPTSTTHKPTISKNPTTSKGYISRTTTNHLKPKRPISRIPKNTTSHFEQPEQNTTVHS